jgi:hypothetical protein
MVVVRVAKKARSALCVADRSWHEPAVDPRARVNEQAPKRRLLSERVLRRSRTDLSKKKGALTLLPPGRVPLAPELEREAVALLAELLLDAAAKRRGRGSVLDGVSGGAIGGVVSEGEKAGKGREAA